MKPDLAEVYDDHVWDVYGFLMYRLGSRADAEDLTQATFERAVKAWPRYDPRRANPKTWLLAIASNLLIDHYRTGAGKAVLGVSADAAEMAAGRAHDPGPDSAGISDQLAAALARLTERDRQVVALRFGGDLSGAEIASAMDLSLANVQQILSRSLRRLRDELDGTVSRI